MLGYSLVTQGIAKPTANGNSDSDLMEGSCKFLSEEF